MLWQRRFLNYMTLLQYTDRNPTMGDVLKAKDGMEGTDWDYLIRRKKQLTSIPLPDMYSKEDWDELSRLTAANYKPRKTIYYS
jgi:hypothetical protein